MLKIFSFLLICTSKAIKSISVDQQYQMDNTILSLNSDEYLITQQITNATFYFQPKDEQIGKYIAIELIFQIPENGQVKMQFSVTKNKVAAEKNNSLLATYQDLNGLYLQKSYQFIQIPSYSFSTKDKFFISDISDDTSSFPYQYTLKISDSNVQRCPGMCGGQNGQCLSSSGLCKCIPGRIDLDCSLNAAQINFGTTITTDGGGRAYLYYEMEKLQDQVTFTFDLKDDQEVTVYLLFENFAIGAASEFQNDFSFQCTEKIKKSYLLNMTSLNFNADLQRYERLLISVYSKGPVNFGILIDSQSTQQVEQPSPVYVYFLIGLGILLLVICIIICIIRRRRQSDQVLDIYSHNTLNSSPNRKQSRQSKYQCAIDQYMPKIFYKTATHVLNETFPEDFQCAMCLVQYEDSAVCRITPCKHVFHSNCICQWLFLHQNCPMCRNDLDEKSLEALQYESQGFFQSIVRLKRKRHEAKLSNILQDNGQSGIRLTLQEL